MKRILIYCLILTAFLQSCKEDNVDLIDGKLPEERTTATLEDYRKILTGAENGWVAYLYTTQIGGGYNFYINFGSNDRVSMVADYDDETASDAFESTYRLKQVMAPSLIFDTYGYIHLLSDPNPGSFGGNTGSGYGADFEFEILEQKGDTLILKGKKRNTEFRLIRASAAQKALYTSGKFSQQIIDIDAFLTANQNLYIEDPDDAAKRIQVTINTSVDSRKITLIWTDQNNEVMTREMAFSFSPDGLLLKSDLAYKTISIKSVYLNTDNNKLMAKLSNGTEIEIKKSGTPILPLHLLIGAAYTKTTTPNATSYEGWSPDFTTRLGMVATSIRGFNVGGQQLNLVDVQHQFNGTAKTMNVVGTTKYGERELIATYFYEYTKTAEGIFKFTYVGPANANSTTLSNSFAPILAQRLNVDTFTLDYYVHPTTGVLHAQFTSIEHPNYIFNGVLQ